jgi:hypothetical protein
MAFPDRDHHTGHITNSDTAAVLADALHALADRHHPPYWIEDPGVRLHLLISLHHQIQAALPDTVAAARAQNFSWAQIGDLLGTTRAAAWNHYGQPGPPPHLLPADD